MRICFCCNDCKVYMIEKQLRFFVILSRRHLYRWIWRGQAGRNLLAAKLCETLRNYRGWRWKTHAKSTLHSLPMPKALVTFCCNHMIPTVLDVADAELVRQETDRSRPRTVWNYSAVCISQQRSIRREDSSWQPPSSFTNVWYVRAWN